MKNLQESINFEKLNLTTFLLKRPFLLKLDIFKKNSPLWLHHAEQPASSVNCLSFVYTHALNFKLTPALAPALTHTFHSTGLFQAELSEACCLNKLNFLLQSGAWRAKLTRPGSQCQPSGSGGQPKGLPSLLCLFLCLLPFHRILAEKAEKVMNSR